jgi:branched-chain amino acid transport system ATP-binding protein
MQKLLEVDKLASGYGRIQIVRDISFSLATGECLGLFGPNGHGKSTLLKAISGLLPCWSGSIRFAGQTISNASPRKIVEAGLILVPQGNQLFPEMTVGETLRLGAFANAARAEEAFNLERAYSIFPRLKERDRQQVWSLSGGERQMVAIGVGLMGNPKLLILDEPTLGLAPRIKDELCDAIGAVSKHGVPLVVVEQDVEFLLGLANRLILIDHGSAVREFSAASSIGHDEIMDMYFGDGKVA